MLALTIVLLVATTLLAISLADSAQRPKGGAHPFNIHDLWSLDRVGAPQPSPDGAWIAFEKKVYDLEANKGRSDIWLVSADGKTLRRLTAHPAGSSHPRWSPDGRSIYFLSSRDETSQVWRIAIDGGEAEQVTRQPLDVENLVVSPNGEHLAFSMRVFPSTGPQATKERIEQKEKSKATGRVYEKLFVRHWDAWKDGRRSHVFVMPAAGGDARDVMPALDVDAPTQPFGGDEEIAFAPDGRTIIFCARHVGREEAWSTQIDIFQAPLDGCVAPRRLTEGNRASITSPVFSPDGKTLAYLAMSRAGFEADRWRIVLKPWPDGPIRVLTDSWDRSPLAIVWSPSGDRIYTFADHLGQRALFAIDVATGDTRTLVEKGKVSGVAIAGDNVVYTHCHLQRPADLFSIPQSGGESRPLTRVNADKLATLQFGEPEQFTFAGWNDETVHAYIVKPVDFDPKKKYPVAFLIHGGPQGSFGNDFHYRWNPQIYAGAGYAAVMVDFHGSTGYGQDFVDSISRDWGGKPFIDLQKGLAAALERCPWMDGDRVAALGASYGGYMINWIAGNWPDRFRCLVNHDGSLDTRFAYFDTEELWFPEWEGGGTPWEKPQVFEDISPIHHIGEWRTPMLVIHGARDFRVPETQGLATFTALQRRGIPSKLLYFPDENHWVLKPANGILWHETVLAWLDKWARPTSPPKA